MKHYIPQNKTIWIVLVLCAACALGFLFGSSRHGDRSSAEATHAAPAKSFGSNVPQPTPDLQTKTAKTLPANLKSLDGRELLEAIPSLQKLALDGDNEATRVLYRRLGACAQAPSQSEDEIRRRENEHCEQQVSVTAQIRADARSGTSDPRFDETVVRQNCELWLKQALDEHYLCTNLTPQQIDTHLDWLQLALQRHDRDAVLDITFPASYGVHGAERIRNAEKLVEIAQIEQGALNDLIATGDVPVLERAMRGYEADAGILPRDAELSYALAYALSLTDPSSAAQHASAQIMKELSVGSSPYPLLTPPQIEAARAKGLALFQSCCIKK